MELAGAPYTLPARERLRGKGNISRLLTRGRYGYVSFLKYCYAAGSGQPANRLMVSVPKKHFRRAVKRNLLKRRLREAYRTQKALLGTTGVDLMLFFQGREVAGQEAVHEAVGQVLREIGQQLAGRTVPVQDGPPPPEAPGKEVPA